MCKIVFSPLLGWVNFFFNIVEKITSKRLGTLIKNLDLPMPYNYRLFYLSFFFMLKSKLLADKVMTEKNRGESL